MFINLVLIVILIFLTAFFVATEFAIVKLRSSRVDQLIADGNKKAIAVKKVISNLDGYLSACQLGITITALGLGWLGKPTVEVLLYPVLEPWNFSDQLVTLLSFVIAFSLVTFLHVVVGELAPKTLAIQKAEKVSLLIAKPIIFFYNVMFPFIWLLNGSARQLIKLMGLKPVNEHEEAHSEDELRIILTASYQSGEINQAEYKYVSRIFEFDELKAKEIMVPRTDMICLYLNKSLEENVQIIYQEQYTRFPVADDNKDHIVGFLNTKQFLLEYHQQQVLDLQAFIRPVMSVSDVTPIKILLKDMQKQHTHIAVLHDEYGGTSGLVTIEDILEEIVGEIRDEFDASESTEIERIEGGRLLVDGRASIEEIAGLLQLNIDTEQFDTIGGWLYSQNPLLKENQTWQHQGVDFIVRKRERNRYRKMEIKTSN